MKLGPNQRKWIRALRSGKFKQTRGKLRGQRGFCCLGVACELFAPDTHAVIDGEHLYDDTVGCLPHIVLNEVGLFDDMGEPLQGCPTKALYHLNDVSKKGFKEIADILVKHKNYYFERSV